MSEPFLSEIRIMSFQFAPRGWALCNGQLLPIAQNQALFSLLGTVYGGNGQTNFALPDLRNRVPLHRGNGHPQGQRAGSATHTLSLGELPGHSHAVRVADANATQAGPMPNNLLNGLARAGTPLYGPPLDLVGLNAAMVANVGGSQPHENRQPFLVLNFCIALQGIFPSRN